MTDRQTRRRYLLAVGATAVAGCAESDSETGETGTDATATSAATASDAETETGNASFGVGAETTFRQYLEAYASGDTETVVSLTHPDSSLSTETEQLDLTLDSVASTTLSEIAEAEGIDLTAGELDDVRAAIEDEVASIDAETYETVVYTAETAEYGDETGYALLVRDGGEWYVYGMVTNYLYDADEPAGGTEAVTEQVTNRLEPVSTVGLVDGDSITTIEITVKRAAGGGDIDLGRTSMQWEDTTGTYQLSSEPETGGDATFSVTAAQDEDGSISANSTLNDDTDRALLTLDLTALGGTLDAGATATARLITDGGATTHIRLIAPETLAGQTAVAL